MQKQYRGKYTEGYAAIINSGSLKAKGIHHVIVVAGPQGPRSNSQKENQLYSCYYNSLVLAHEQGKTSIAFPSISTGIYKFPKDRAAAISLKAVSDFIKQHPTSHLTQISIHFLGKESDHLAPYQSALT